NDNRVTHQTNLAAIQSLFCIQKCNLFTSCRTIYFKVKRNLNSRVSLKQSAPYPIFQFNLRRSTRNQIGQTENKEGIQHLFHTIFFLKIPISIFLWQLQVAEFQKLPHKFV